MAITTVTTSYGVWNTEIYEISTPFTSENVEWDEEIDGWLTPKAGINIKLTFTPNNHNQVRLVQFKRPGISPMWEVDRSLTYKVPWYGFDNDDRPLPVGNVGDMVSLTPLVGSPRVGEGGRAAGSPAFLVDNVREPVKPGRTSSAIFTTFAYDLATSSWLGGVKWGYTVTSPEDKTSFPTIWVDHLMERPHTSPHEHRGEEQAAIKRRHDNRYLDPIPN